MGPRAVLGDVRALVRRARGPERQQRRAVQASLALPAGLGRRGRERGSVWGVSMVRNEIDTIEHVVRHLVAQGVDGLLIADNGSTDGTLDLLRALSSELPLHVAVDGLDAYFQATKMTALAAAARRAGADWIVPFDADELWFGGRRTLAETVRGSATPIVRATLHNVFPSKDDDPLEVNPFARLRHIDPVPHRLPKVAFRSSALAMLGMGNHRVDRRGRVGDGLHIAHFPWRSFDQLRAKVARGGAAIAAAGLADDACVHWTAAAGWDHDLATAMWDRITSGQPADGLIWVPSGAPLVPADVLGWRSWQLDEPSDRASVTPPSS
jgi:hypothetical protein